MKLPVVNRERIERIKPGETVVFADCTPKLISSYLTRIKSSASYTQQRILIVLSMDEQINAQTVTRTF